MKSLTPFTLRLFRIALLVACLALAVEAARGGGGGSHGSGSSSSSSSSGGGDTTGTGSGSPAGGGYHPNNNDDGSSYNNHNSNSGSSSSGSGTPINIYYFGNGNAGGYGYHNYNNNNNRAPFDTQQATNYRTIHGILASLAMVVLFPIGSIILRVLPGKWGLWVHAVFQVLATCVYVSGAALGIHLVKIVRIPSGTLLSNTSTNYHPILGLILLALFLLQPVLGVVHHVKFRKVAKRQIWSYLHLVNGRGGTAVGMINGGLGLHLAQASNQKKTAYAAVAAVIGAIWIGVSIWAEVRRKKKLSDAEKAKEGEDEKMVESDERRRSGDKRKTGVTAWDVMKK